MREHMAYPHPGSASTAVSTTAPGLFKAWFFRLRDAAMDFMEDDALQHCAALAYYAIFSLAPLILIAVSVASLFFGEEAVRGQLEGQLTTMLGEPAAKSIQALLKANAEPSKGILGSIVGFVTLLFGASGVFGQLKAALNSAWNVRVKADAGWKHMLRDRFLSFGMVLTVGFLLLVSLVLTTALAALSAGAKQVLPMPDWISSILNFAVALLMSAGLFAAIFRMLPDVKVPWRAVRTGALMTALLFESGKFLLSFYLGRESTTSGFGAAGSLVVLLLWIYYTSAILMFGAEFTQVYAREKKIDVEPEAFAEWIKTIEAPASSHGEAAAGTGKTAPASERHEGIGKPAVSHPVGTIATIAPPREQAPPAPASLARPASTSNVAVALGAAALSFVISFFVVRPHYRHDG